MHIAIIGGGFSGAACALHLLRDHPGQNSTVTVIEPRAVVGAGLAYSAASPTHRTNVAAARMSVLPENALHFHDWLHAQGEPARDPACAMPDGRLYPARAVFGRYVDSVLRDQVAASARGIFHHVRTQAVSLGGADTRFVVGLQKGAPIEADAVVLAVSHTTPDLPVPLRGIPSVLEDPWDLAALRAIRPRSRVLVVGTGLTACDCIAFLLAHGHQGEITAISRHGLLPRPRTSQPVEAEGDFATRPETSATALLRRIRRAVAIAQAEGRPWENIVDALRQQAGVAWGTLDWTERRRLLRHLRTIWDVHRFQSAPQIDAILAESRRTGALAVRAARLVEAQPTKRGLLVTTRRRGMRSFLAGYEVETIINCTGPGHRSVTQSHPLLRALADRGELRADPADLGIWVDGRSRVLRADGTPWRNLFVAGPLARGTFGELMGLPQVNLQPRAVAAELAGLAVPA